MDADWRAGQLSLPWWLRERAQSRPGPQVPASYVATSSETTLGRLLTQGTATVNLIAPHPYGDRMNQVDLRVAKSVSLPKGRLQATVMFNALN